MITKINDTTAEETIEQPSKVITHDLKELATRKQFYQQRLAEIDAILERMSEVGCVVVNNEI